MKISPLGPVDADGLSVSSVDASWFGFTGDGKTDNSAAWNSFSAWASSQSSGVVLRFVPALYNFDHSLCLNCLNNIANLRIVGYGSTFQNTYVGLNGNGRRAWPLAFNQIVPATSSYLINQTNPGDTSFSTITPGDAANIAPGSMVLLASLDVQYFGYPWNPHLVDYVRVLSVANGVSQTDRAIKWQHRPDFPDGPGLPPTVWPCGKARVWVLNQPTLSWDFEHIYEGMQINQPLAGGTQSGAQYITISGRKVRFVNAVMQGISPTLIERVEFHGCRFTSGGEPDKLIDEAVFDDCEGPALFWQSSSVNRVRVRGGRYDVYNIGAAKVTDLDGVDIGTLSYGNTYGVSHRASVRGGFVRAISNPSSDLFAGTELVVDGINVSYANGSFAVLKAGTQLTHWGLVPGAWFNIATVGNGFSSDVGSGVLLSISEDATNVYYATTLSPALWPSWAGTLVRATKCGDYRFYNVTGCDDARTASRANSLGLREWELLEATLAGTSATGGAFSLSKWGGAIIEITVIVRQASALAGSVFIINSEMVSNSTFTNQQLMTLTIDATTPGKRVISPTTWTNQAQADTLKFGGASATVLPAGQIITGLSWGKTANSGGVVELQIRFDTGMYGKPIILQTDASGNQIANTTGMIP